MALSSDKLCILNRNTCALRIQGKQNPMIAPKENNKLELRSLGALVSNYLHLHLHLHQHHCTTCHRGGCYG